MPEIRLAVATVLTEVQVGVKRTPVEVAHDQIKEQEKQRVLGFIPNFFVSYVPNAAPLAPKQKFELAWRGQRLIPSPSWELRRLREFNRRQMPSGDTGKACKVIRNASVRPMPTLLQVHSSEAGSCHLC